MVSGSLANCVSKPPLFPKISGLSLVPGDMLPSSRNLQQKDCQLLDLGVKVIVCDILPDLLQDKLPGTCISSQTNLRPLMISDDRIYSCFSPWPAIRQLVSISIYVSCR